MRSLVVGLALLVSLVTPGFSQRIEDGWKGFLPFKSTRNEVEKVLGDGKAIKDFDRTYEYLTDEGVISAVYAGKPCDETIESFDQVDVPADTVLRYSVKLKQPKPLSSFTFDKDRFNRWPDEPTPYFYYYQAREKLSVLRNETGVNYGIWFEGDVLSGRDYVKAFHYEMPWGEREKRPCKKRPS